MEEQIQAEIEDALSNLHTATIGKITKVNNGTVNAKVVINRVVNSESVELPEFIDIPVFNISGGGSSIVMPIKAGDYCLLVVSERNLDNWYVGKDNASPVESKMFDYSDCIAFVGVKPMKQMLSILDMITVTGDINFNSSRIHTDGTPTQDGSFPVHDGRTITIKNGFVVGGL